MVHPRTASSSATASSICRFCASRFSLCRTVPPRPSATSQNSTAVPRSTVTRFRSTCAVPSRTAAFRSRVVFCLTASAVCVGVTRRALTLPQHLRRSPCEDRRRCSVSMLASSVATRSGRSATQSAEGDVTVSSSLTSLGPRWITSSAKSGVFPSLFDHTAHAMSSFRYAVTMALSVAVSEGSILSSTSGSAGSSSAGHMSASIFFSSSSASRKSFTASSKFFWMHGGRGLRATRAANTASSSTPHLNRASATRFLCIQPVSNCLGSSNEFLKSSGKTLAMRPELTRFIAARCLVCDMSAPAKSAAFRSVTPRNSAVPSAALLKLVRSAVNDAPLKLTLALPSNLVDRKSVHLPVNSVW
mmetsp:Transcript_19573/g.58345  ORF Transcript_19573/g.58345 Transcript_19573/m.58345 type:complete len:359 (-) Transcript_19573:585-1661(-)